MKRFAAARKLVAVTALISLLAVPALAAPARLQDDLREPAIAKFVKAVKRLCFRATGAEILASDTSIPRNTRFDEIRTGGSHRDPSEH